MATKANIAANARRSDLERRVRRKLRRLENKGVNVGSIDPRKQIDTSDTRSVKNYNKKLEAFMSRQNQYVAGRRGLAIPAKEWKEYQKIERKWNAEKNRFLQAEAGKPIISSQGLEDMTRGMKALISPRSGLYGAREYQRKLDPSRVESLSDLKQKAARLKRELSPEFKRERAKQFRENLLSHMNIYNSEALEQAIEGMTNEELQELQTGSLFVEDFYTFSYDWTDQEYEARVEALLSEISAVKTYVRSQKKVTRKRRNRSKRRKKR